MSARKGSYQAIVFDLDGTLIDSAPDIAAAVNTVLQSRGWPQQSVAFVERFIGYGPRRLLLDILVELGLPSDAQTVDDALREYITTYSRAPAEHTVFYPHVKEDLAALHAAGIRLGICTNKPHDLSLRVLSALQIAPFFDAVVGAELAPACKPDPRHLLAVAERMGINGSPWAYVGDTPVDQATATAAGIPFFAVSWGCGGELAVAPEWRLKRLSELAGDPQPLRRGGGA